MRKILARAGLTAFLLVTLLLEPMNSFIGHIAWSTGCAIAFALAVMRISGRASLFVPFTLFVTTVLFPIAVLGFVGESAYGSWLASVTGSISLMISISPFHGSELLIPMLVATAITLFLSRRMGPNNSFKPKPLRGSA